MPDATVGAGHVDPSSTRRHCDACYPPADRGAACGLAAGHYGRAERRPVVLSGYGRLARKVHAPVERRQAAQPAGDEIPVVCLPNVDAAIGRERTYLGLADRDWRNPGPCSWLFLPSCALPARPPCPPSAAASNSSPPALARATPAGLRNGACAALIRFAPEPSLGSLASQSLHPSCPPNTIEGPPPAATRLSLLSCHLRDPAARFIVEVGRERLRQIVTTVASAIGKRKSMASNEPVPPSGEIPKILSMKSMRYLRR